MPAKYAGGFNVLGLATPLLILAVVFMPIFFRRRAEPPDTADPGSDGGPANGPWEPPVGPSSPPGGLPLPDAEQADLRLRDHGRLAARRRVRRRGPGPHPERRPARVSRRDQIT